MNKTFDAYCCVLALTVLYESIFMMTREYGGRLAGGPILAVGIGGLAVVALLEIAVYPAITRLKTRIAIIRAAADDGKESK